jgi:hypothetical protein
MTITNRRLEKLETKLAVGKPTICVCIIGFWDAVSKGFFKDDTDKDKFIKWRASILGNKAQGPFTVYNFTEQDVKNYIGEFRINGAKAPKVL